LGGNQQTARGVMGDATKATVEKGEQFLAAAKKDLVKLVHELKNQAGKAKAAPPADAELDFGIGQGS
jgi:hypothetical protein